MLIGFDFMKYVKRRGLLIPDRELIVPDKRRCDITMFPFDHGVVASGTASGFLPTDLADLFAWYRGDLGVTIATGVSEWADQSGNGHDLVQATGANQPTYGATLINSQPGMTLDGTNDSLSCTGLSQAQPLHSFIVYRPITWVDNDIILGFDSTSDLEAAMQTSGGASPETSIRQGESFVCTVSPTLETAYLLQSFLSGASSFLALNDGAADQVPAPQANTATLDHIALGTKNPVSTTQCGNFEICELIICTAQITGADLTSLMAYINARYALW